MAYLWTGNPAGLAHALHGRLLARARVGSRLHDALYDVLLVRARALRCHELDDVLLMGRKALSHLGGAGVRLWKPYDVHWGGAKRDWNRL